MVVGAVMLTPGIGPAIDGLRGVEVFDDSTHAPMARTGNSTNKTASLLIILASREAFLLGTAVAGGLSSVSARPPNVFTSNRRLLRRAGKPNRSRVGEERPYSREALTRLSSLPLIMT
jgi:hypothetical protein